MAITQHPLVSVLMTAFNRQDYIGEAIESVLASTYSDFELIIVDDLSTDNTINIAKEYAAKDSRIKVYRNEKNLGDYVNRNKAASYAQGKYLKYVDADDKLYHYGLQAMVEFTERFPDAGFGLGAFPENERSFPVLITPREIYLESFGNFNHFDRAPGSGLIKREVFEAVGGFSGRRMIGDYEFWFKVSRYYSMVKLPLDLYWNRIHGSQESQSAYAKKNYAKLRQEVLQANLSHPDCPLTPQEIESIYKKLRRQAMKDRVFETYSKFKKVAGR